MLHHSRRTHDAVRTAVKVTSRLLCKYQQPSNQHSIAPKFPTSYPLTQRPPNSYLFCFFFAFFFAPVPHIYRFVFLFSCPVFPAWPVQRAASHRHTLFSVISPGNATYRSTHPSNPISSTTTLILSLSPFSSSPPPFNPRHPSYHPSHHPRHRHVIKHQLLPLLLLLLLQYNSLSVQPLLLSTSFAYSRSLFPVHSIIFTLFCSRFSSVLPAFRVSCNPNHSIYPSSFLLQRLLFVTRIRFLTHSISTTSFFALPNLTVQNF